MGKKLLKVSGVILIVFLLLSVIFYTSYHITYEIEREKATNDRFFTPEPLYVNTDDSTFGTVTLYDVDKNVLFEYSGEIFTSYHEEYMDISMVLYE